MGRNKSNISITISTELVKWIETEVNKKRFANRSHAIEYALYELKSKG